MNFKKLISVLVLLSMFVEMICFAAFSPENNIVAQRTERYISPGLKYINSVEICDGIRQEIHAFEYIPESETEIIPAFGQYIYGFNSVGNLVSSYDGEGRVVGGINTDFFITSTGIPLSCLVSDKEIISSCDNRVAIGFTNDGYAVIGNPEIKAELILENDDRVIPVAHINKTPGIWGLYLVTDKFSSRTHSSVDSTEIILKPVFGTEEKENNDESSELEIDSVNEYYDFTHRLTDEKTSENINPDDDEYDDSSDASETDIFDDIDLNKNGIYEDDISDFSEDAALRIGKKLRTIVTDIRSNSINGTIPEGCLVACIPNENLSYLSDGITIGDEITVSVAYNEEIFSECSDIFGAGSLIVHDGMFIEQEDDSIFKYRNPRTAAGIKADGTVLFVSVDGRHSGVSSGYTIQELADYLISHGCIEAVNFDGGGSTTFYAADIGELNSSLKNNPSDGFERRVADGMIFVNNALPSGDIAMSSMYPRNYYVYNKGVSLEIDAEVLFADSTYFPVSEKIPEYQFIVDESFGVLEDNIFTPSDFVGDVSINVQTDAGTFEAGVIHITDIVDNLEFYSDKKFINPFEESASLSLSASLNTIPVLISTDSPEIIIKISDDEEEDGLRLSDETEAYIDENLSFVPIKRDVLYIITVTLGEVSEEIEIFAEAYPFEDTASHWGAQTAYDMYKKGIFIGEITPELQRMFFPERNMTVSEFCTALARLIDVDTQETDFSLEDIATETIEEFEAPLLDDEHEEMINECRINQILSNVPDWAKESVELLYSEGFIDELISYSETDEPLFDSQRYITRMDVIRVLGKIIAENNDIIEETELGYIFSDFVPEQADDINYLNAVYDAGIINGYEDATLRQDSNLTRAEAAAIFSRFMAFTESNSSI